MTGRIGAAEGREEGLYRVILGQNPPEIAYWERGEWWLAGDARPWKAEAATIASDRLVFQPRWRWWLEHRLGACGNGASRSLLETCEIKDEATPVGR